MFHHYLSCAIFQKCLKIIYGIISMDVFNILSSTLEYPTLGQMSVLHSHSSWILGRRNSNSYLYYKYVKQIKSIYIYICMSHIKLTFEIKPSKYPLASIQFSIHFFQLKKYIHNTVIYQRRLDAQMSLWVPYLVLHSSHKWCRG